MKILYLCTDLGIPVLGWKGAAVHVRALVAAFSRASHDPGLVLWPAIGVPPERRGGPMTDRLGKCCREAAGGRRGDDEPSKIATGGVR